MSVCLWGGVFFHSCPPWAFLSLLLRLSQRQRYVTTSQRISQDTSHHTAIYLHDSPTWTHQQRDTNETKLKKKKKTNSAFFHLVRWNEMMNSIRNTHIHTHTSHTGAFPKCDEDPSSTTRTHGWGKDEGWWLKEEGWVQQAKWTWLCGHECAWKRNRLKVEGKIKKKSFSF